MGSGVSVAQEAKRVGNEAFKQKDFRHAVEAYTRAIEEDEKDPKLYTNRAAAYLGQGCNGFAYYDAVRSAELDATWPKAYFRMGQALLSLGAKDLAVAALRTCAALAPNDSIAQAMLHEAEGKADPRALRGYLLSWGSDEHSCLGHRQQGSGGAGGRHRESAAPRPVEDLKTWRISDVACGVGHNVAVSSKGRVYAWGLNSTSQCADAVHASQPGSAVVPVPALVPSLVNVHVVAVACGAGHSVVLTDQGVVYVWGLGANGQLGLGEKHLGTLQKPQAVEAFKESPIIGVACGFAHTMFVDNRSRLFACGWNSQGQVGIREPSLNISTRAGPAVPSPAIIPELNHNVQHVACGGVHTAVVLGSATTSPPSSPSAARRRNTALRASGSATGATLAAAGGGGSLWCFGANACGQLGLNSCEDALAPAQLALPAGANVALVVCGEEYTFGISERRDVYAWGLNNVGQLGLPVARPEELSSPSNYVLQPTHVSALKSAKVEWIVCGQGISFAVTQDGAVWTWGRSEHGEGVRSPELSKGFAQHEVLSIVAGRQHFCAVCRAPLAADAELLQKSTAAGLRVGRRIEFEVTFYTPKGDVWQSNVAGQSFTAFVINEDTGHGVEDVDVFDNMDGTVVVSFKAPDAAVFRVHCMLAGEHVRGSPRMVEVEAGTICLEKCVCTLQGVRQVHCGNELTFYVVVRDAQDNYVFGGRQRASVEVFEGGVPTSCNVEDAENGQSRLILTWDTVGARRVRVSVSDDVTPVEELKCCVVEVIPGSPSPPHFVLERSSEEASAGVPYQCALMLCDRFGNTTDELLDDLEVFMEGPQVGVPVNIRPPAARSEPAFGGQFAAWRPPAPERCRLGLSIEAGIAGTYDLFWTSKSAGSGRAKLRVRSGPPDLLGCIISGIESRIFQPGPSGCMDMAFTLLALDAYGNRCDAKDAGVSMRLKRWGCSENVLAPWQELSSSWEGDGQFAATGQADVFGEWHLEVRIGGGTILGSPFVIHLEEDPTEIRQHEDEERQRKMELERKRQEQQREAEAERHRKLAEERDRAEKELQARKEQEKEEKKHRQDTAEEEKELERRRKIYDRLKREEATRKRAEETLRKEVEERRARMRKEKEKKEKRCGGGFTVVFKGSSGAASSECLGAESPPVSPTNSRPRRDNYTRHSMS